MLLHSSLATSFVCACCLCRCFVKFEVVLAAVERSFQHRQSVHLTVKLFSLCSNSKNCLYLQLSRVALHSGGSSGESHAAACCSCCWCCHCYSISPCGWRPTNQWWWKIPHAKPQPINVPLLTAPDPTLPPSPLCVMRVTSNVTQATSLVNCKVITPFRTVMPYTTIYWKK